MTKQSKQRKGQRNKSLPGFMAFAAITVSSSGYQPSSGAVEQIQKPCLNMMYWALVLPENRILMLYPRIVATEILPDYIRAE